MGVRCFFLDYRACKLPISSISVLLMSYEIPCTEFLSGMHSVQCHISPKSHLFDTTFPLAVIVKMGGSVMELRVLLGKEHRWRTFMRQG
jgi:hypothetical protein